MLIEFVTPNTYLCLCSSSCFLFSLLDFHGLQNLERVRGLNFNQFLLELWVFDFYKIDSDLQITDKDETENLKAVFDQTDIIIMHKIIEQKQLEEFKGANKKILIHFITEYESINSDGVLHASSPKNSSSLSLHKHLHT